MNGWHKKVEKSVKALKMSKKDGINNLPDDQKEIALKKDEYTSRQAEAEYILSNINEKFPHLFKKEKEDIKSSPKKEQKEEKERTQSPVKETKKPKEKQESTNNHKESVEIKEIIKIA